MIKKLITFGVFLLILEASISSFAFAEEKPMDFTLNGTWRYVGGSGPGNYSTIQSAINAANSGDTVFVFDDSSPYDENIIITKSINLLGENKLTTIIRGESYYYYQVISAESDNIVISDFTIRHGIIGLFCSEMNDSQITNMIIEDTGCGIYLWRSSQNTLSNNRISSCYEFCIYLYDHSMNNVLINNSLPDLTTTGLYLGGRCDNNHIEKNLVKNKINGIVIEWSFLNVIRNNNFITNTQQAYFENSSLNLFFGNYWDDWASKKPRPIPGLRYGYFMQKRRTWTTYDWRPAQDPYDIQTVA